jgi:hypothetical protein
MRISMKKMELMANLVVRVILAFFLGQENKMVKMEKMDKNDKMCFFFLKTDSSQNYVFY